MVSTDRQGVAIALYGTAQLSLLELKPLTPRLARMGPKLVDLSGSPA